MLKIILIIGGMLSFDFLSQGLLLFIGELGNSWIFLTIKGAKLRTSLDGSVPKYSLW